MICERCRDQVHGECPAVVKHLPNLCDCAHKIAPKESDPPIDRVDCL